MSSKGKDAYWKFNTLASLATSLIGRYVIVDFRNDSNSNGKLEDVDGFMNLTLSDVVFTDPVGNQYYFTSQFLKFRNIRDIQFPKDIQVNEAILRALYKLKNPKSKLQQRGAPGLKQSRLIQRQMETLKRVEEIKKEKARKKKAKEDAEASTSTSQ